VTAVEPVREMREVLERVLPDVAALDGTAEAIPLPDAAADAVTVAQAFHWFDGPRTLVEIHRVLRPGGGVALLWNVRDQQDPLHRAYAEAIRPYRGGDYPEQEATAQHLEASDRFERHERRAFRNVQLLDADGLVARAASISFVAGLDEPERAALLERIRALAPPGEFEFPYVTKVFTARSRLLGQNRSS
jgi:SAM-dependent methyltransferase